jgi:hypothetical protein
MECGVGGGYAGCGDFCGGSVGFGMKNRVKMNFFYFVWPVYGLNEVKLAWSS